MLPFLLVAVEETSKWDIGLNHATIVFGLILTILGIAVAYFKLRAQHKETLASRERAAIERNDQKQLLEEIAKEFKPNHGSSLVDRVNDIGTSVNSHHVKADKWFVDNDKAHEEIKKLHLEHWNETSRRVDGLYEIMLGGTATSPRKTAARHLNREEPS